MAREPALPGDLNWAWRDHARGAVAEDSARAWLGQALDTPPGELPLARDARGRPRLGLPGLDVGWSHSGEGLLVVLGRGLQVGVDLEWLRPRPKALNLARRFFAAAEADWLEALPGAEREPAFIRLWCAKEAVLKAHGRGLAFGLARLVFAEHGGRLALVECDPRLGQPGDWRLEEWTPRPGYHAVLAWRDASLQCTPA